ncbi:hypothetical protein BY458DRAFT_577702, partial [Sporodiniella umbellata]
ESNFSKRKYNKGNNKDGSWVLGGVEKTSSRRLFMVTVKDRCKNTSKCYNSICSSGINHLYRSMESILFSKRTRI